MGAVLLEPPEQHWVCPNCTQTETTRGKPNRFHHCSGLAGLLAPMVPDGADCAVEAVVREDYEHREKVVRDGAGRPISAVVIRHGDGSSDVLANAPTAQAVIR